MRFKMLPVVGLGLLGSMLVLSVNLACQKKKEISTLNGETTLTTDDTPFNKNVGGFIDSALGNRWKRNLAHSLSKKIPATSTTTVYYLPASVFSNLTNDKKVAGICFYYGEDAAGKVQIVPVAVDVKGYMLSAASLVTTNGTVNWNEAKQWRLAYKQKHPSNVWGHFWGTVAIDKLLSSGAKTIRMDLGLSDEGTQQIMFSNAADLSPESFGDRTRVCPPYCPTES